MIVAILTACGAFFLFIGRYLANVWKIGEHTTPELPPNLPVQPPLPAQPEILPVEAKEALKWGTIAEIRHSVRLICDDEGLSFQMKDDLCATIQAESEFKLTAVRDNLDKFGKVWSKDWGLCQWNDYWHGKEISPADAVHDPEKAVRLMCAYFKRGQADQWVAHKTGVYRKYKIIHSGSILGSTTQYNENMKNIPALLRSSANPEKFSLFITALGTTGILFGLDATMVNHLTTLLPDILSSALDLITKVAEASSIVAALYGAVRKVTLGHWSHPV